MGFQPNIVEEALINAGYRCEACGKYWHELSGARKQAPLHGHSETTLHIVWNEESGFYIATSVPPAHRAMLDKPISPNAFMFQKQNRKSCIRILCHKCHLKVHAITDALSVGRYITGDTKNNIPFLLEMVTTSFILNGGQWIS